MSDHTSGDRRLFLVSDTLAGGMGAVVRAHAAWFSEQGWTVVVAAPEDGDAPVDDVHYKLLPAVRSSRRLLEMAAAGRALRSAWSAQGAAATVIHVHGMRSFLLCRLAGLPRPFVTVHGTHPSEDDPAGYDRLRRLWFALLPALSRGATTLEPTPQPGWMYSPFASPLLAALGVLPFPAADTTPTFGWLGLLDSRKQPETFVRAIANVQRAGQPVRGLLGGEGPRAAEIAALIEQLGAPVEMLGQTDPVAVLAPSWVLCLFARSEGTPLAVMEAMWVGRSVIGSDVPGIRYIVGDTGVLADDVAAATAAILALSKDHQHAAQSAAAAAVRVRSLINADTPWPELERDYLS